MKLFSSVVVLIVASAIPFPLSAKDLPIGVIERLVNLRKDPSTTHLPIRKLLPDEKVEILDSTTSLTYLKVKATEDGKKGWVWKAAVTLLPPAPPPPPGGGPPPTGPISPLWTKQTPVVGTLNGSEGPCGPTGDGSDTKTNFLKNRSDALPVEVHDVDWSAIMSLGSPVVPTSRLKWKSSDTAKVQPFEGVAIRTIGFLAKQIKVESGGLGESTNCHFTGKDDVDWHIYLVQHFGDGLDKAVIVETTPRVRKDRQWDNTVLAQWVESGKPVRISGYLMLDPEHRNMVGSSRGTTWEIHPVMKIEVCHNAAACAESEWVDLEQAH